MKKIVWSVIFIALFLPVFPQIGSVDSYQIISATSGNFNLPISNDERFGTTIDTIGDLNNDGITDLVVGAPLDQDGGNASGAVFILFMRANKTVKYSKKISRTSGSFTNNGISNGDYFGRGVAGIGDINNDGIPDIAVGAENDADGGSYTGSIRIIFLDTNGTVKGFQKISKLHGYNTGGLPLASGSKFGVDVSLIGDIDSDGVNDIVVANFWDNGGGVRKGAIWVLKLYSTGKVKTPQKIYDGITNFNAPINNYDYFGVSVTGIGDFDHDGVNDIATGAFEDDEGGNKNGSVYIIKLFSTGAVKGYYKISNSIAGAMYNQVPSNTEFGVNVAGIHDIDGNGVKDLFVGNYEYNSYQYGSGYICFMDSTGVVAAKYKIDHTVISNINAGDRFGFGVSAYKDIDNDGYPEIIAGVPKDDDGGSSKGGFYILSIKTTFKLAIQKTNSSCNNMAVGTAKAVPSMGNAPYTYLWSNGSTNDSIGGLSPGTYSVTVTDATNKTQVRSVTIGSSPSVGLITSNNYTMCQGNWTTLMAVASGGAGTGYVYHWNQGLSGSSSHQVTPSTTTTYTVFASDGNGCYSDTSDIVITVNPVTTPMASGLNVAYCASDNAVVLQGSPSGGYFTGSGVTGNSSSGYNFDPSTAGAGTKNVIYNYTNSYGCIGRDTISTTVFSVPNIQFSGLTTSYCQNNSDIALSATPSGGSFSINNTAATIFSPATLGIGTYKIKYAVTTSAGCSNTDSIITYVNPVTTATLSGLSAAYCENGGSTTLMGSPNGGSFLAATGLSGNTYNPSQAGVGQHSISYKYTNIYGCTDTATQTTTVNPISPLTISTPKTMFCHDDAVASISVTPTGGTLSGQGVNNANKTFNPVTAGLGTKTVHYTFTNPYGCTSTDSLQLTVNSPATLSISGLNASYCSNNEAVTISGYPTGGSFSGAGISGNTFNPSLAGTGTKAISYIYNNGCVDTLQQNVSIHGLPTVSFSGLSNSYCENQSAVALIGSPSNGTFYGSGISGTSFNPSTAGVGIHNISYISPLDGNGCMDTVTNQTNVHGLPNISFGSMSMDQCISSNSVPLSANPTGGTFTGNAVSGNTFNPSTAGLGTKRIYYSYTDANSCSSTDSFAFVVHSLPTINFSVGQSCANINAMSLSATPSGGSFSGAYITGSIFSPVNAGIGSHQVVYSFTDSYGCSNSDTEQVVVNALPNINFSISQNNLCSNGSPISLSATPTGGTFSGTAVSNSSFNPSTAGVGTHDIIYSYTGANLCSNTDTASIVVHALPSITFGSMNSDQCINTTAVALSATPSGGSFSGASVTGSTFNPSSSGVGQSKVYYSYSDAYNCSNTDSITFTIHSLPTITFNAPQSCANIASVPLTATPSGGSFIGSNITGNNFNASTAGVGNHQVIYSYTDNYNCTNSDTQTVVVHSLPNVNFSINPNHICKNATPLSLTALPTGGSFSGSGITGNQFNPSNVNIGGHTLTYTYTDGNQCTNSDTATLSVEALPSIDLSPIAISHCFGNTADTLLATPLGGTYSGSGIIGNLFIPSIAGQGQHWIQYSYSNAYGCNATDSIQIMVHALPSISFTGLNLNYCLNDANDTLIGNPMGGSFSGSGLSGNVFNPQTAGLGNHMLAYQYTDSNQCSVTVVQSTHVNDIPQFDAGNDTLIACNSQGIQIGDTPQSNLSYFWQPSAGLNNVSISNPIANPMQSTGYMVTINNIQTGCMNTDSIQIDKPIGPTLMLTRDTAICKNDTLELFATGGNTYQWSTGDTSASITMIAQASTNIHVIAFDSMSCATEDSVLVKVNPLPIPNLGADSLFVDSITLNPGSFSQYLWSTGDTSQTIFVLSPPGIMFSVIVTDSNGCQGKDSIFVFYESIPEIQKGLNVSMYPNPTKDYVNIAFSQNVYIKSIDLYNDLGQLLSNKPIGGNIKTLKFDVTTYPKGKYYLRIIFDGKVKTLPIFVQ